MITRAVLIKLLVVLGVFAGTLSPGSLADLAQARQHNEKFQTLSVAKAAGYGILKDAKGIECIAEEPGGMGVHYVNGRLVGDDKVDANTPEALVYEPQKNGHLTLVAAEYVVFQAKWDAKHPAPPTLYGRRFQLIDAGNRFGIPAYYELHVWMWKANPRGVFDDWNSTVSCAHSTEHYS
jgi:hypothetical protein